MASEHARQGGPEHTGGECRILQPLREIRPDPLAGREERHDHLREECQPVARIIGGFNRRTGFIFAAEPDTVALWSFQIPSSIENKTSSCAK